VTSGGEPGGTGPGDYRDEVEIDLLGRRVRILELSREVSTTMPIYPGHVGVAFWPHVTHEQVRQRLPEDTRFQGYAVRGMVASEHVSTHVDAIWHFNPERPDLTIVELEPGMTLLYHTGATELWDEPLRFVAEYAGLDREASEWLLDQGIVNLGTDAISTDNPADLHYPNHLTHAERLVIHTEMVNNITRIPRHGGFWVAFFPLRLVGGTGSPARALAMWEVGDA
jgi:kynurenine formamidase